MGGSGWGGGEGGDSRLDSRGVVRKLQKNRLEGEKESSNKMP